MRKATAVMRPKVSSVQQNLAVYCLTFVCLKEDIYYSRIYKKISRFE